MPRRAPKRPSDWFTCSVCGAEVQVGALACRACGADDKAGWSEDTLYDDLDLPEPDLPDTFADFERMTRKPRTNSALVRIAWIALVIALIALIVAPIL